MFGLGDLYNAMTGGGAAAMAPFKRTLRCFSLAMKDKSQHEYGDKIILPQSAFEELIRRHIQYPMMFHIANPRESRSTHCSVLEFTAEEGRCYIPHWMMQSLLIAEGTVVDITNVSLPSATFCKFRPHSKDFLDIADQRAVLEKALRSFSCVTQGEVVCFKYLDKVFYMDIVSTKPSKAVSIIETNMDVDFDAPADYVPPKAEASHKEAAAAAPATAASAGAGAGGAGAGAGAGSAGSAKLSFGASDAATAVAAGDDDAEDDADAAGKPKFVPFAGRGRRLDGKDEGDDDDGSGGAVDTSGMPEWKKAMLEARQRRRTPTQGSVISSASASRPSSAARRRRSVNRFEQQRRKLAFSGTANSLK